MAAGERIGALRVEGVGEARAQLLQVGAQRGSDRRLRLARRFVAGGGDRPEGQQQIAFVDQLADLGRDRLHLRVDVGAQLVLHLHRLDNKQGLAGMDVLAGRDGELHDGRGHRGVHAVLGHGVSSRGTVALRSERC